MSRDSLAGCSCRTGRRAILRGIGGFTLAGLAPAAIAQSRTMEIVQPEAPGRAAFMARAFSMRRLAIERGDQAYGAVVVRGDRIVGEGVSAVVTSRDPTAHAERQAIRDALRRLGTADLAGCELYGTSRACPMCETAAAHARIARMVHGSSLIDAGEPRAT
jgi:tRNA(adenine34) deaminase